MKKKGLIMLIGMVLLTMACENTDAPLECGNDIVCTEEFVMIAYAPKDAQNNPIQFDSFYSHNLDIGIIYDFSDQRTATDEDTYIILTDQEIGDLRSGGTTIRFIGEKDGEIIHQQDFLIGHDCCHVELLAGPGLQD